MENSPNKKKPKISATQAVRHLIQLLAFVLMPGLFISAFGAVKDVSAALLGGTFSIDALSFQILLLLAVIPVTALLGRFFCGYFCSFGAMADLLWFISGRLFRKRRPIGPRADSVLKLLKYAVLAFIVVAIWTLGVSPGSLTSPWTIFGMYASFSGWPSASFLLSVGAALLLLIVIGSVLSNAFSAGISARWARSSPSSPCRGCFASASRAPPAAPAPSARKNARWESSFIKPTGSIRANV